MPDLLDRKFTANEPNRVDVGDITYLPCKAGKNMYLATVIDTYSRKLAGYDIRRPQVRLTGHRCFSPRTWCAGQS
ncbi:DDE-type integrase/transposase/recombinase [Corynebacterium macginleyi]|uniref:DDE-type integrase/transposase/recombinase n=1 Tax=Corynebacterium macginleyi TaxID=38290 RepID=UPI00398B0E6E